jgi:hypothetical protein
MGIFLGYVVLTLLVYGQTLQGGFLVDDWWWAATAKAGGFPLFGEHRIFFRPISSGLFVGLWHLFGPNTIGYHVANLAFLTLTAAVIRQIWLTVTNNKQPWAGTLAGAIFILWPSHSEAVGWISAFSDLLIVLLGALSLWTYLLYLRRHQPRYAVIAAITLIVALLTKEPAVTLPLIVFLLGQVLKPREGASRLLSLPSLPVRTSPTEKKGHLTARSSAGFPPSTPSEWTRDHLTEERGLELLARKCRNFSGIFAKKQSPQESSLGSGTRPGRGSNRGLQREDLSNANRKDRESDANSISADVSGELNGSRNARSAYFEFAVAFLLTAAYLLIRRSFLGGSVGGYNGYRLSDVFAAIRGWKLTVNLANLYFPIAKFIAINQAPSTAKVFVRLFVLATGTALVRTFPRTGPLGSTQKRLLALVLLVGLVWVTILTQSGLIGVMLFLFQSKGFLFASPLLVILVGYLFAKVGKRWWNDVVPFFSERKIGMYWIPASIIILLIDFNYSVTGNLDMLLQLAAIGAYFYAIYLTRPLTVHANSTDEENALRRLAFAMFFVSLIALLPGIALPINIDGQQGRFSYLGTFFSVISLVAAYAVILKPLDVRRTTTGVIAAILFLAAETNAADWAQAGSISKQTTALITSLLPARRIYVVATPDTIGAALLFRGGIDQIPFVAAGNKACKVELDAKMVNFVPSDEVECRLFSPTVAGLHVTRSGDRRLEPLRLIYDNPDKLFENPIMYAISFPDFKQTDHAIYIDAKGAHLLE